MKGIEEHKLAVISTAHMSQEDSKLLDSECTAFAYDSLAYGYLISLSDENVRAILVSATSSTFRGTVHTLFQLGYSYLLFDADGPVVDNLPKKLW